MFDDVDIKCRELATEARQYLIFLLQCLMLEIMISAR